MPESVLLDVSGVPLAQQAPVSSAAYARTMRRLGLYDDSADVAAFNSGIAPYKT